MTLSEEGKRKISEAQKKRHEQTKKEIEEEKRKQIKEEPDVWEDDLFMDKVKEKLVKDLPEPVIIKEPAAPQIPEPPPTKAVVPVNPREYSVIQTKSTPHYDADRAHEDTLRYFVENTELGVLSADQMGVIALVSGGEALGMDLRATVAFFEKIRTLSSGAEGKGRVQVKEVITAGAFPMSLLFGEQKSGILESIKSLFGRKEQSPQVQR